MGPKWICTTRRCPKGSGRKTTLVQELISSLDQHAFFIGSGVPRLRGERVFQDLEHVPSMYTREFFTRVHVEV